MSSGRNNTYTQGTSKTLISFQKHLQATKEKSRLAGKKGSETFIIKEIIQLPLKVNKNNKPLTNDMMKNKSKKYHVSYNTTFDDGYDTDDSTFSYTSKDFELPLLNICNERDMKPSTPSDKASHTTIAATKNTRKNTNELFDCCRCYEDIVAPKQLDLNSKTSIDLSTNSFHHTNFKAMDNSMVNNPSLFSSTQQSRVNIQTLFPKHQQSPIKNTTTTAITAATTGTNDKTNTAIGSNGSSQTLNTYKEKQSRRKKENDVELNIINNLIFYNTKDKGNSNADDCSTLLHPKLDSLEEKMEDLRQEANEKFWHKRGKVASAVYQNKDKRAFRRWFKELDYDKSGEVNVDELQDALLSSGILKTKEQIKRVLTNADKNNTNGIDFEEFLSAIHNNVFANEKKVSKLQSMNRDANGFDMSTLISQLRRKKLYGMIVANTIKRSSESESLFRTITDTSKSRREREKAVKDLPIVSAKHDKTCMLHSQYIDSLSNVLTELRNRSSLKDDKAKQLVQYDRTDSIEERKKQILSIIKSKHRNTASSMSTTTSSTSDDDDYVLTVDMEQFNRPKIDVYSK